MKKLKIAMLAPLFLRIPPEKYGGSEFVIYYLANALVKKGHSVDLYATKNSKTKANLISIRDQGLWEKKQSIDPDAAHLKSIYKIIEKSTDYDIIHDHLGSLSTVIAHCCKTPIISTQHVPLVTERVDIYKKFEKNFHLVSISNDQRKPYIDLNFIGTVYNGIPVEDYDFNQKPRDYFCFLGRFDPKKGAKEAIEIAEKAGVKLIMAAKIEDNNYYKKFIEPKIDNENIKYIGEVNFSEKNKLLKGAKALISPIQWSEPFGLVVPEANACGTPVVGNRRGSYPEIIKSGINGYLVNNIEQAVQAIKNIDKIDRSKCRKFVEDNFSISKMVSGYEELYYKILA
jgi:glycosyltransferase involved in cell wall biosynthesis